MTDGSKKRLGGWTRLWLVFSAVWIVGCSAFFFYTAPERESVELSLEELDQYRVNQIVQAIRSGVDGIKPLGLIIEEAKREPEEEDRLALGEEIGTTEPELEGEAEFMVFDPATSQLIRSMEETERELEEPEPELEGEAAVIALAERYKEHYESPSNVGFSYYDRMQPTPAMQEALEQKRRPLLWLYWFYLFKFLAVALLVPMAFFGSGWTVRWVWDGFFGKAP